MPDKLVRMMRSRPAEAPASRPVMPAVGGDSGSGKTTLAGGLAEAVGRDRCTLLCVDDYHRSELPARPLCDGMSRGRDLPAGPGRLSDGGHSEPLAITQELLLLRLAQEVNQW